MEFRSGPKCYCEITQAWMYQPHQAPSQMVLACDKQMKLEDETAAPAATVMPSTVLPATSGLGAPARRPRQPATKESVTG